MKTILIKYALTPTLAVSTMLTGSHYFSTYFLKTESQLASYTQETWQNAQARIRPYIGITEPTLTSTITRSDIIQAQAHHYGLNPKLIEALITIESNGQRDAERFEPALNTRSIGLTQVLVTTAKIQCPKIHWTDLYQEEPNIACGTQVLAQAIERQHSLWKALVEYNGGASCASRPTCFSRASEYAGKVITRFSELSFRDA